MSKRSRHWKQRFNPDAKFVWNKSVTWEGEQVEIGSPIPDGLKENRNRLRTFWESGHIALADFVAPDVMTGSVSEEVEKVIEDNSGTIEPVKLDSSNTGQGEGKPEVNWRSASYQEKMGLARDNGYSGRNMSVAKLDEYLTEKLG